MTWSRTEIFFSRLIGFLVCLFIAIPAFAQRGEARSSCIILDSRHKRLPKSADKDCSANVSSSISGKRTSVSRKEGRASGLTAVPSNHKRASRGKILQSSYPGGDSQVVGIPRRFLEENESANDSTFCSNSLRRKLSSRSAIVMDSKTGEILYAHAPDLPGQPASTVKVLTGLIAVESLNETAMVPVSRRAAEMPSSKVFLRQGSSYCADDLINAVLLGSANDASVALAEKIGGSETEFARLMNLKARELGAQSTICKTATGLTAVGQKSTARDLAVMFNQAMKNQEFADRMSRTKVRTRDGKTILTHNKAFWKVPGAKGGKTGYTLAARQTYVGKFSRGDDDLIVAIMGSESMWNDIKKLVEYGFKEKGMAESRITAAVKSAGARVVTLEDGDRDSGLLAAANKRK